MGHCGHRGVQMFCRIVELLDHILRHHKFTRGDARQIMAKAHKWYSLHFQFAGRGITPRQGIGALVVGNGAQIVVLLGIQKRIFRQSTRRDQSDDIAFDDGFVATLFRLSRRFELFANCHAKPLLDQGQKVLFRRMMRHAAHCDILALVLAAFGEGNIERFGGGHGIVKKQLIEITHAIKQ